MTLRKAR